MACPYFAPRQPFADTEYACALPRPLGSAWRGECRSPSGFPEASRDDRHALNCCNMGYSAGNCRWFPAGGPDSVRFSIASDQGPAIQLHWVQERNHLPAAHGRIEYRRDSGAFVQVLDGETLAAQALAYVASYMKRRDAASR